MLTWLGLKQFKPTMLALFGSSCSMALESVLVPFQAAGQPCSQVPSTPLVFDCLQYGGVEGLGKRLGLIRYNK